MADVGRFATALQENQEELQGTAGHRRVHENEEKWTSGDHGANAEIEGWELVKKFKRVFSTT